MSVSVVLADDHSVVREGLRAILSTEDDIDILAEVADGLEAVETVKKTHPDVLVLDLVMPNFPGLEVIKLVLETSPATKIVVLSMHADEAYVLQALRQGATGYVTKDSGAHELLKAIREAVEGRRYLSPPLSQQSLKAYDESMEPQKLDPYESLSPREREVLHLAASAHTNNDIAERLDISRRTVEAHRANLMRKLRINSQASLIRYAIEREIFPER